MGVKFKLLNRIKHLKMNNETEIRIKTEDELQQKLRNHSWIVRKQGYEQLRSLFEELSESNKSFSIGGHLYRVNNLIPFFEDLNQEDHPLVLLSGLDCVHYLAMNELCSGKDFVKLIDQGFDKFPLRSSKGKEIMQKFADIIECVGLDTHFMSNKLANLQHEKCLMYALEIVGMLGMSQLCSQIEQISRKSPKNTVREVALEIYQELQQQQPQQCLEGEEENISSQNYVKVAKLPTKKPITKNPKLPGAKPKSHCESPVNLPVEAIEKLPQYEQMSNKEQQSYSEKLLSFFERYYKLMGENQSLLPVLPPNHISILSHIVRLMSESNNHILSTNGLKILKLLIENNSPLLPRSYPLLFIFQKFKLRASHQINHLLFDLCDSIVLNLNGPNNARLIDFLFAIYEGGNSKKANVKYGSVMSYLRLISIIARDENLFADIFDDVDRYAEIMETLSEEQCDAMKKKLAKNLMKCLDSLPARKNQDKKFDERLHEVRIMLSVGRQSGVCKNAEYSAHEKNLKKTLSKVGPKIQTFNSNIKHSPLNETKSTKELVRPSKQQPNAMGSNNKLSNTPSSTSVKTTKTSTGGSSYKIINPEEKMSKILEISSLQNEVNSKNSMAMIKKYIAESLKEMDQCIYEARFQLFYYSELLNSFIMQYQPNQDNCEPISEYLLQLILKFITVRPKASDPMAKLKGDRNKQARDIFNSQQEDGLRIVIRVCLCQLVLGKTELEDVLNNMMQSQGIQNMLAALLALAQKGMNARQSQQNLYKVKKRNRKVLLRWLDAHVSADFLSEKFFTMVEEIENSGFMGRNPQIKGHEKDKFEDKKIDYHEPQYKEREPALEIEIEKGTKKKVSPKQTSLNPVKERKNPFLKQAQVKQERKNPFLKEVKKQKSPFLKEIEREKLSPETVFENPSFSPVNKTSLKMGLEHEDISHIEYADDPSASKWEDDGYGSYLQTARSPHDEESKDKWNYYLNKLQEEKKSKEGKARQGSIEKKENHENLNGEQEGDKSEEEIREESGDGSERDEADESNYIDVQSYKSYINKIRESYLPKEYIQGQGQASSSKEEKAVEEEDVMKERETEKQERKTEKQESYRDSSEDEEEEKKQVEAQKVGPIMQNELEEEVQREAEQPQFTYKIINASKLEYMLKNTANPYSHLRNQILIPFRKHKDQVYFLQEFHHFVSTMSTISHPQPYNSLLLTVILLFESIHANRDLISPLQELYEHMATLQNTNVFLRTIISLFHSVIEETTPNLRSFLITILTKSVARLMPFVSDPVELLRDFSQFYNIGENVYFEMYEKEYKQICRVIEGEALYELVEQGLLKEGDSLKSIADNWFETGFKQRVKEYIEQIIDENDGEEEETEDQ